MPPGLKSFCRALGRIDKAFLFAVFLYFLLRLFAPRSGMTIVLAAAVYLLGVVEAVRLGRLGVRKAIWRLRNRLMVTYLFIAVVPVILILMLVGLGGYAVLGQVASHLVTSELDRRTAEMLGPARLLASNNPENRAAVLARMAPFFERRFPGLEICIDGPSPVRYPPSSTLTAPPPGWGDTSGVVAKDGHLYGWAHVYANPVHITFLAPLTHDFIAGLVPGLGDVSAVYGEQPSGKAPGTTVALGPSRIQVSKLRESTRKDRLPPPVNRFDTDFTWVAPLAVAVWDAPPKADIGALLVRWRTSSVLRTVFGKTVVDFGTGWFLVFVVVANLFLIVEFISLVIGVSLTRTITGAVHQLYEGTQHVKEGDFSHRIEVRGNDQLAELTSSFNTMTENLERLIVVAKEKERLQSELEIAREVQAQLFPKSAPALRTLELSGLCNPARMVSGDYYDFLALDDTSVALAIGDVAGKGISAALLMAAIQSIMRTQLSAGVSMAAVAGGGAPRALSTSHLVSVLNKQLYANTSLEKYATFYLGLYHEPTSRLTYTNAGHLPPFLLRGSQIQRLDPTGTVVGAFPFSRYEEQNVELVSGDLLVAYTDGIVEPENEYGEMFGEERLLELLAKLNRRSSDEIIAEVMETVRRWTGSPELQDDMTLLLVRRK